MSQLISYPDFDGRSGRGAEPVPIRREAQSIDDVVMVQGVEMLLIMQIPQHGLRVLSS